MQSFLTKKVNLMKFIHTANTWVLVSEVISFLSDEMLNFRLRDFLRTSMVMVAIFPCRIFDLGPSLGVVLSLDETRYIIIRGRAGRRDS